MKITNTEILLFIMGYQGGTVHQVSQFLNVSTLEILTANYESMQILMRKAQKYRNSK